MTIAACYASPEGIVLGADSTASWGNHYFNSTQKLFEIGENSTLGIITWGLAGFDSVSYRTLIAQLADDLARTPAQDVSEVAQRWATLVWDRYTNGALAANIAEAKTLSAKTAHDPLDPTNTANRTADEQVRLDSLIATLSVGFCIAGHVLPDRSPAAYSIALQPLETSAVVSPVSGWSFWGAPNMIGRLIFGIDSGLLEEIAASKHWTGTSADLSSIARQYELSHGSLPIRDAIDFVHSSIASTIKAMKFSNLAQICGGPIEIAVITTDRKFRWVRHKPWDAAISEGDC